MATPSVPPERGTAMTVWSDKHHTFYYPPMDAGVPEDPTGTGAAGRAWIQKPFDDNLAAMLKEQKKIEKKGLAAGKFPLRTALPNFSTTPGVEQTILTNHFQLETGNTTFYEYEILDLEQGGRTKKKVQALFRKAVTTWDCLKDDQDIFATDGQKSIISWKKLHEKLEDKDITEMGSATQHEGRTWRQDIKIGKTKSTPARFAFVGIVDITSLLQKTRSDLVQAKTDLSSVERCINILIAKSFDEGVIKLSRTKFFVRSARSLLGKANLLEIIRGYYYTVKPGMGNMLMNFNVATSAFFRPVLVSEFLDDTSTFRERSQRLALLSKLHVYVEYQHKDDKLNRPGARIKKVTAIGDGTNTNIKDLTFNKKVKDGEGKPIPDDNFSGGWRLESGTTNVVEHLKEVFAGVDIKTNREAVNVGSTTDPIWYAQELLRIVPYQLYTRPVPDHLTGFMVKQAAHSPAQSQWLIQNEGLRHLGFTEAKDELIALNGVPLSLYPLMMQVNSKRLPLPGVRYKYNSDYIKGKGGDTDVMGRAIWNLLDHHCFHTIRTDHLKYYIIQTLDQQWDDDAVTSHMEDFELRLKDQMSRRCRMDKQRVMRTNPNNANTTLMGASLESKLEDASTSGAQLVILMLPAFDRYIYADFKNLADRRFGLRSLCVAKPEQLQKGNDLAMKYMTNIAQKINLKYGGVNSAVDGIDLKTTLILGADVVHPPIVAFEECPSIASLVGSMDAHGGTFLGSMRLQSKDKKDREIIDEVESMARERIAQWIEAMKVGPTAKMPEHIIYYRDGVSEGQYSMVKSVEVRAIKDAFDYVKKRLGLMFGTAKVTAIVGGKRHHTRFYPMKDSDKDTGGNNNCMPGTYVDRAVVSPYYRDFYLQSHSGIKGTARPTHYFMINDGSSTNLKTDDALRTLTHRLCYTYCRATTGVSYATPTYYADRLCDRGRMYLPNTWTGSDPTHETALNDLKSAMHKSLQHERDILYRNGNPFDKDNDVKDPTEIAKEIEHRETIRQEVRKLTLAYAEKEFYSHKEEKSGNPWNDKLSKVMFWM